MASPRRGPNKSAQGRAERRSRGAPPWVTPWVTAVALGYGRRPGLQESPWVTGRPGLRASRVPRAALRSALGYHVNAPSGREEDECQAFGRVIRNYDNNGFFTATKSDHGFAPKGPSKSA